MVAACLNINTLVVHIDELRIVLLYSKIDILCINESKLDDSIADHGCIPGYDIVRRYPSVIRIRSRLNYKQPNDSQSQILENLKVEIIKLNQF